MQWNLRKSTMTTSAVEAEVAQTATMIVDLRPYSSLLNLAVPFSPLHSYSEVLLGKAASE